MVILATVQGLLDVVPEWWRSDIVKEI